MGLLKRNKGRLNMGVFCLFAATESIFIVNNTIYAKENQYERRQSTENE